jgi:hypothetical protein
MASTQRQRKRTYDGKRMRLILERLREARRHLTDAIRLAESDAFQLCHQPNASMILEFADRALLLVETALTWTEERLWMHEQEKAERIKQARGDGA